MIQIFIIQLNNTNFLTKNLVTILDIIYDQ